MRGELLKEYWYSAWYSEKSALLIIFVFTMLFVHMVKYTSFPFVHLCFLAVPVPVTERPVLHPPKVHPSPRPETTKPAHQWHRRAQTRWLRWVGQTLMLFFCVSNAEYRCASVLIWRRSTIYTMMANPFKDTTRCKSGLPVLIVLLKQGSAFVVQNPSGFSSCKTLTYFWWLIFNLGVLI